ncbi:hypothetical protein PR202_ga04216 [Eleusine coracana subsp. coracana]|uniref:DRBM domain-containing protein n=1 Tax=Eleusine coracana subsp. coracana TaxID=191504 RepID=A0AAV5BP29_ELECO|nr:hypothetical protein QOZ80_5AG0378850 [Eleusine coracana subsp. coracana]GJM88186.1 hypothetical protein PR202_ga04216 [Eleusine coracana subsp. coracana]
MDRGGAAPPGAATSPSPAPGGIRVENCYVFKSRLQEFAQKAGLPTPEYHSLKEGPSHEPIFRSTVVVNNTKYESLPRFSSRKAAEQSAAEVALMEVAQSVPATKGIRAVQETGLCKNLLQEYAQKMNYAIPSYVCTKQASGVAPFICTIEIGGIQYIGATARTKKEAEIKAARTALLAIQGRSEGCTNGATKYIVVPGQRQVKEAEKKTIQTPKPLKVRRGGYKKKWNKRKFMRKTDQTVDDEKDGGKMAGDAHESDAQMQAIIPEEPSTNTTTAQPAEEVNRVEHELLSDTTMMQCNGEGTVAEQEPPSGTAVTLLHDDEARRVDLETSRGTAITHPNEEVRILKQESSCDTAMLQPGEEARLVESEPPRDIVQSNDTLILQSCNLVNSAEMMNSDEEGRSSGQESLSFSVPLQPNGEATSVKEEPPGNTATMQIEDGTRTMEQVPPSSDEWVQPHEEGPRVENSKFICEH